ncbi:MAG: oligopeptide transporter, OPT family [Candidatus Delongbacteria bacterium]|nr:oligopeptide transporter, OPT family [Candidatus Delongbacteria bacterium]
MSRQPIPDQSGAAGSQRSTGSVAELTVRVIILGVLLSVIMGAANVYLGLKVGMTVSASIPAAVVAMLILRGLFRNGTILEANQVQTAASAGESLAAGIIFTMPAIILIGVWESFDWLTTTLIAFSGGLLGILFMIPMRRIFVTGNDLQLKYPEGVACAAVLKAGDKNEEADSGQARAVIGGAVMGLTFKLLVSFVGLLKGSLATAGALGSRIFYFGGDVSPALIAVGYIVRLNIAVLIFIGGALGWLVGIPLLEATAGQLADPLEGAFDLWSTQIRYVGVGAMVIGGIDSIFKVRHGLKQAVAGIRRRRVATGEDPGEDISSRAIAFWSVVATLVVAFVYYQFTRNIAITVVTTIAMVTMSFFFTAVASYIVGLVGNSNSPVSGMTITAVLFTGALLLVFGFSGVNGMVATLGVAAIVCCAACTSGDVCNDLKTGHLVGASPRKQQIMQIAGVAAAALVMAPVLQLLHANTPGGIGGKELAAPQASLFASLARGFFGDGQLPWNMVAWGAGLGLIILLIDQLLRRRGTVFRAHLMPIAVGMYLPFELATPILAGGLLAFFFTRGDSEELAERKLRRGVLFASGAIAGESLMGIGLAFVASLGISRLTLPLGELLPTVLTFIAVFVILLLFFSAIRKGAVGK